MTDVNVCEYMDKMIANRCVLCVEFECMDHVYC